MLRIWLIVSGTMFFALLTPAAGGPREFGRVELQKAMKERGLSGKLPEDAIAPGAPESYAVTANRITGTDERGVMYGLLAAAEQIRADGKITPTKGAPQTAMRGIRYFLHNEDLERDWYYSREYWEEYLSMLARNRFNRFNLVFAHQTDYLAPPYPFWVDLPEFPAIRARNLSAAQREKNLEMLRYISQAAADRGIDFTLGVWEHDIQHYRKPPMKPMTEGLTPENIGPYSYAALKKVLKLCPAISSVQMRTNAESGIPNDRQVDFFKNYVFRAIRDAGRPVILDLRGWIVAGGMVKAAEEVGVPVRLSTKYWAEDTGRPYQPPETYANYSYLNFLQRPHSYKFYWELWGLGSHRLLLWGDPEHVRRAVSTFGLGGGIGFEIDPPLAQKGFGNRPGKWGVFTTAQSDRMFWQWEFERYWMFYRLWGRLSYDSATPDRAWMDELKQRFGPAAMEAMEAYTNASHVLNEIVAVHLADPNMYIWPEINPGGLTDAYREVLPSDWRYVASIPEAVKNRLEGIASAKQTAPETAARLEEMARRTEDAVARAKKKVPAGNREWSSSESDFLTLTHLARYHAHKQRGTYLLSYFYRTGDVSALAEAKRELQVGLEVWERLVKLTSGLYPAEMAFGPDDIGHWKDKLPYVRHDLVLVSEREELAKGFGRIHAGFDFGGPVKKQPRYGAYREDNYVLGNTVQAGFTGVDATTRYTDEAGYGWLSDGERRAEAIPLTPYLEVRAVSKDPKNLPRDVVFRDFIRGKGGQQFAIKTQPGEYQVLILQPDRTIDEQKLTTENGRLTITFPEDNWSVSGIVVKASGPPPSYPPAIDREKTDRPTITHQPPRSIKGGEPLSLKLDVGSSKATAVRLYYRPVNQHVPFKMLESAPGTVFTIPGNDISDRWDLMYYFEVLNDRKSGWFQPDPLRKTPYYVVKVVSGS